MKHYFDVDVAEKYGIEAAIIIEQIAYWVRHNEHNGKNLNDGKYWMYNSIPAFKKQHTYMSERKIRRTLKDLEKQGVISTGNYNKKGFDRTKWYTIEIPMKRNGDVLVDSSGQYGRIDEDNMAACSIRSGRMEADNMAAPIPLEETLKENINNDVPVPIENKKVSKVELHFEACWALYPKKVGKKKVTAQAKRALKDVTVEQFQNIVEKELKNASEIKYLKGGERFFNGEYWSDHLEADTSTGETMPTSKDQITPELMAWMQEIKGSKVKFAKRYGKKEIDVPFEIQNVLNEIHQQELDRMYG